MSKFRSIIGMFYILFSSNCQENSYILTNLVYPVLELHHKVSDWGTSVCRINLSRLPESGGFHSGSRSDPRLSILACGFTPPFERTTGIKNKQEYLLWTATLFLSFYPTSATSDCFSSALLMKVSSSVSCEDMDVSGMDC
jgi:hypothetical protein